MTQNVCHFNVNYERTHLLVSKRSMYSLKNFFVIDRNGILIVHHLTEEQAKYLILCLE